MIHKSVNIQPRIIESRSSININLEIRESYVRNALRKLHLSKMEMSISEHKEIRDFLCPKNFIFRHPKIPNKPPLLSGGNTEEFYDIIFAKHQISKDKTL